MRTRNLTIFGALENSWNYRFEMRSRRRSCFARKRELRPRIFSARFGLSSSEITRRSSIDVFVIGDELEMQNLDQQHCPICQGAVDVRCGLSCGPDFGYCDSCSKWLVHKLPFEGWGDLDATDEDLLKLLTNCNFAVLRRAAESTNNPLHCSPRMDSKTIDPKQRLLGVLTLLSAVTTAGLFITQATLNRDAPIRKVANEKFIGKYGAEHTEREYEIYKSLNSSLLVSSLMTFVLLICMNIVCPKTTEKIRHGSS